MIPPSPLERPTLILNRLWQPVRVAAARRALVLMCKGAAQAVDPSDYRLYTWDEWLMRDAVGKLVVRTPSLRLALPDVVTLLRYDRTPRSAISFSKRHVLRRDRFTCQYCGVQPGPGEMTIDHVLPRSRGGGSTWDNCVAACTDCNRDKGDRLPDEARMRLRSKPGPPNWRLFDSIGRKAPPSWTPFFGESAKAS